MVLFVKMCSQKYFLIGHHYQLKFLPDFRRKVVERGCEGRILIARKCF